jgi:hypothetical protein
MTKCSRRNSAVEMKIRERYIIIIIIIIIINFLPEVSLRLVLLLTEPMVYPTTQVSSFIL